MRRIESEACLHRNAGQCCQYSPTCSSMMLHGQVLWQKDQFSDMMVQLGIEDFIRYFRHWSREKFLTVHIAGWSPAMMSAVLHN